MVLALGSNVIAGNSSDNILQEIIKLEQDIESKANDSDVLHKNGDETITGNKTFACGTTTFQSKSESDTTSGLVRIRTLQGSLNDIPTSNILTQYITSDKNNEWTGHFSNRIMPSGVIQQEMCCRKKDKTTDIKVCLGYDVIGNTFFTGPRCRTNNLKSTTALDVITAADLNDINNNVVHKTNDEEISGTKTFLSDFNLKNNISELGVSIGTNKINFYDKNKTRVSVLQAGVTSNAERNFLNFMCQKPNGEEGHWVSLYQYDNYANFTAPTVSVNNYQDNNTTVVTTAYGRKAGFSKAGGVSTSLSLTSSGQKFTAPASGWYVVGKGQGIGGRYLRLTNETSGLAVTNSSNSAEHILWLYMPVRKGDIVSVTYDTTGAVSEFKFVYDFGAN